MRRERALRHLLTIVLVLCASTEAYSATCPKDHVCYTVDQNRKIKKTIANYVGARAKLKAQKEAISTLKSRVKKFVESENKRRDRLVILRTEAAAHKKAMQRSTQTIRTSFIVIGVLAGVVVIGGVVAVIAFTQSSSALGVKTSNMLPIH